MNQRAKLCFLAILLIIGFACRSEIIFAPPEEVLIKNFSDERDLLKSYLDNHRSYEAYMEEQIKRFPEKQRNLASSIRAVNAKFEAMDSSEQIRYELKWRERFQPVVDDLHEAAKALVLRETAHLDREKLGKIRALGEKLKALEQESDDVSLVPRLFIPPNSTNTDEKK